jgi:site-specific recombinase XerD
MRHTSATHQVDAGIDIRIVKENLRHSMLETTMKYQHTESDSRYEETVNKFGKKD